MAIDCLICPRQYLSAMQNGLLLCTLVMSMAHGYVKVAKNIEAEEKRATQANEKKTLGIGDSSGPPSWGSCPFVLETNATEWKTIALRMVRAEMHGVSDSSRPCFTAMVDRLERRQREWHTNPPGAGFPDSYRITDGQPKPPCLCLLEDAKKTVVSLDPTLLDIAS
ncbi:Zn2-Cys6 binuclear cluster domain [Fusarium albosuccineum]|uniref:Zn2-Cys6 binuclear cluster domain n=1 Tax=Fusarium albosuccineum TaxID=1237068 RepID=A0A8H4L541_9HYPO|nr:Zn2-Cys6 binuclear cluster domain [Fusarium albosuccineum]